MAPPTNAPNGLIAPAYVDPTLVNNPLLLNANEPLVNATPFLQWQAYPPRLANPLLLHANEPLVNATPFLQWQAYPPASPGGPAQVGIPHSRAVKVFLRRCTLDQTQVNGGGFSNVDCFLRDGLTCPPAFATYVGQQNSMIALCTTIATIMCCTDRGFTWENPPDLRGPPHLPWAWPDMGRSVSSVWQTSWLVSLRRSFDLVQLHSAMCMFGSEYRKFFVLLMPRASTQPSQYLMGNTVPALESTLVTRPPMGLTSTHSPMPR
eukprot:CAMPEP_0205902498 /NCGR_PEP_ID=MMETSP1083-20121108/28250_1 /ASSEMBLY_ACC=CAM_ASM_000430 /TAXON_ID=97485 /ORGANISM="Prymnesium parvum, Strain Texoma1" /LENGTH=262 /DNA_ID=CAMNT_0053268103 /DNA_START=1135 /DNA_END=1924 /DNA_ORIENTATION=+